jgi:glycine/D-amino acid oxidase-like deaminating enzyme
MQKENYDIWIEGVEHIEYPRTTLPNETNILIVGGGITGITSAYLLAKAGINPILLEKRRLGEYATGCTTGFLSQILNINPSKIIGLYGEEKARLIFQSHREAIDNIEKIINLEKIDCEFKRGSNYIYANSGKEESSLLKLAENYKRCGVNAEYKKDNAFKFNSFGYIEIFNEAKFNATKYITSLAKIAKKNGAIIAENTIVLNITDKKDMVLVEVESLGIIKAKKILSATQIPFGNIDSLKQKYNLYRTYVLEYNIPINTVPEGTYEDILEPYHYFRVDKKNNTDRLIIGGNDSLNILNIDHEIGANIIKKYTHQLLKNINLVEVRHWSGLILEPVNGLASIGNTFDGNIFYAFGFSGNGMTYSYIASKILLDQLTGRNNPYSKIYSTDNKLPWWKNIF